MGVVAAFIGGMAFSLFVFFGSIWWITRDMTPRGPDDCPHCEGTGFVLERPE